MRTRNDLIALSICFVLQGSAAWSCLGQCDGRWISGGGFGGVSGQVRAEVLWDPDGSGSHTPLLVVGGNFNIAGDQFTGYIAAFDPASKVWTNLSGGVNGVVRSLAVASNGDLIVGGDFTSAGGVPASHLARWNGTVWSAMGDGVNGSVTALCTLPSGDTFAGGTFTLSGSNSVSNIARWDGTQWVALGTGVSGPVAAMTALPDGELVVGGYFGSAGGNQTYSIARWDGSNWSGFGSGLSRQVSALAVTVTGQLVASGTFQIGNFGPTVRVAQWDGANWTQVGAPTSLMGNSLLALPDGRLLSEEYVWNGTKWNYLDSTGAFSPIYALCVLPDGTIAAGGNQPGGVTLFNGAAWEFVKPGNVGTFTACSTDAGGDLLVGASRAQIDTAPIGGVARRLDGSWSELGVTLPGGGVNELIKRASGHVVAVGSFRVGQTSSGGVAEWDGSAWSALGTKPAESVPGQAIEMPNGDIVVAGSQVVRLGGVTVKNVAKWNGTTWSAMGDGLNNTVNALAIDGQGMLIAGGTFTASGSQTLTGLARWSGAAWQPIYLNATSMNVLSLLVLPDASIVVGGNFSVPAAEGGQAVNIARWDGTAWHAMKVTSEDFFDAPAVLLRLPTGEIVASISAPLDAGGVTHNIALWDGTSWHDMAGGLDEEPAAMTLLDNGDLVVVGQFTSAGNTVSSRVATFTTRPLADFNNDGFLDIFDFNDFITCFEGGECPAGSSADFNGDGFADIFDFNDFVTAFETGC